jgi:hypothetical protein
MNDDVVVLSVRVPRRIMELIDELAADNLSQRAPLVRRILLDALRKARLVA